MDRCWSLLSISTSISKSKSKGPSCAQDVQARSVPFRTLTWTVEYPFVTFLTLRITFDIATTEIWFWEMSVLKERCRSGQIWIAQSKPTLKGGLLIFWSGVVARMMTPRCTVGTGNYYWRHDNHWPQFDDCTSFTWFPTPSANQMEVDRQTYEPESPTSFERLIEAESPALFEWLKALFSRGTYKNRPVYEPGSQASFEWLTKPV